MPGGMSDKAAFLALERRESRLNEAGQLPVSVCSTRAEAVGAYFLRCYELSVVGMAVAETSMVFVEADQVLQLKPTEPPPVPTVPTGVEVSVRDQVILEALT